MTAACLPGLPSITSDSRLCYCFDVVFQISRSVNKISNIAEQVSLHHISLVRDGYSTYSLLYMPCVLRFRVLIMYVVYFTVK